MTGSVSLAANRISNLQILKGAESAQSARMPDRSCKSLAKFIFVFAIIGGSLNMEGRPRRSDTAQIGVERLERETDGGIGFESHSLECVEEPPALADEEPIGGEACNRSDGASKSIGQRAND